MLCRACRRIVPAEDATCPSCGAVARPGASFELVLDDGRRIAIDRPLELGRTPENDVVLDAPSVSRRHARVAPSPGGPTVEDLGSKAGTTRDGTPVAVGRAVTLGDGTRLGFGAAAVRVERARGAHEAGRTIVAAAVGTADAGPRIVPGCALKRLDAEEGDRRYVLLPPPGEEAEPLRMARLAAEFVPLLDGSRTLDVLVHEATTRGGAGGPAALAGLLAGLADHGLIAGIEAREAPPLGRLRRFAAPRILFARPIAGVADAVYRRGGFLLFTTVAKVLLTLVATAGLVAFAWLVSGTYGTPFVVAKRVGLGGLIFLVGRLAVATMHEAAHALALTAHGRRPGRSGLKLLFVFPYAFVDTTEAWLIRRRGRIGVALAGPVSDLALGGLAALAAVAAATDSALRDVFFQVAFGAYLGAFYNLNPLLDRDGYSIASDALGEPRLRERARASITRRLAGLGDETGSARTTRDVRIYGVLAIAWTVVGAVIAGALAWRYVEPLSQLVGSRGLVVGVVIAGYVLLAIPVLLVVGLPVASRRRLRRGGTGG